MRTEGFRGGLLTALVIASLITPLLLLSPSAVHAALAPHDPIYINGNAGFTIPDPVNGGGSGTENNPYIIENWDISAESAEGIEIRNTTAHFVIRNCYVHDGIDGIILNNVKNGKIENNHLGNNRFGILLLNYSDNNLILNNTIENNLYGGLEIYAGNNTIYHNNFINNTNQAYGSGSNYWDDGYPSGGNYWSDYTGVDVYRGENQDILGHDGIGDTPYYIPGGSNRDRYPFMSPWSPGRLTRHYQILISGDNDFTPANGVIGEVGTENDPYVIEDWVIYASTAHGIEIRNTDAHFVIRNCVVENGMRGRWRGIHLYNVVNGRIKNNICRFNGMGISLSSSDNNTLANNTCKNNETGIQLSSSNNNHVYHNIFVNNMIQAYDTGSNYWDDGYPSGGNYWSDYTGVDSYRGENRDIPGSDGIGDTPYYIPGDNNLDRYPFMNPFPLPWTGWTVFSLEDLYTVNLEKILDLENGSKLVVKFYTYGDAFENENVIENFVPPWHVEENELAHHPEGIGVKKVRLDLTTDNTENVISTIASFTVTKTILEVRFTEIPLEWALAGTPEEKTALEIEFSEIPLYWALAPD